MAKNITYLGTNSPCSLNIDLDDASETIDLWLTAGKDELNIDLNIETAEVLYSHIGELLKELYLMKK